MSSLQGWETCTPEIARIIESSEINIEGKAREDQNLHHHEEKEAFQCNFATDGKKICSGMELTHLKKIISTCEY